MDISEFMDFEIWKVDTPYVASLKTVQLERVEQHFSLDSVIRWLFHVCKFRESLCTMHDTFKVECIFETRYVITIKTFYITFANIIL